ncbi:hypothetical protein Nepgr_015275 [Nepenthes gracilis]|uniref:Uncharacterized protein n=1 Tax=Nepenthes gracilis TaxID=150966 RepID=A0AAD3SMM0_NEPGR|nr:hypothetical protein Nepgr_015275 [Nepenthes gracilis]
MKSEAVVLQESKEQKRCVDRVMKPSPAISVLFLLLLFFNQINGRRGPEDYWRAVMRDHPIPDAIRGRLNQDWMDGAESSSRNKFWGHFSRNFDTRPVAIIYHHQVDHMDEAKS